MLQVLQFCFFFPKLFCLFAIPYVLEICSCHCIKLYLILFFLRLYLFLERGREGEKEREKHQCVVASHVPPTGVLACNPGMCPDWVNRTRDPLVRRTALNPLSHNSQGSYFSLKFFLNFTSSKIYITYIILTIFKYSSAVLNTFALFCNQSPELFPLAKLKIYTH